MSDFTIVLLISMLLNTKAFDTTIEYQLNVGTVLFTNEDLNNNRWSKTKVGLLRARRSLQKFLPPANIINSVNEDYIDALMEYFEEGYATIKNEATDPETDRIMTVALSDVIGGYLKSWALPITKFSFYGGTVTQTHVLRLFEFYDELRNYMGTDGEGWTSPDASILSLVDINVAEPRHSSNTRSMSDPCDHLAYFTKTPTGLSIPIPHVNWDKQSNTMFVPLKNHSLIPLGSFNSSTALFKYYDAAKNCIQKNNAQQDKDNFDEKFQKWLSEEVVPHLNDDRLYLAFESILSLVNTSKNLNERTSGIKQFITTNSSNYRNKFSIGGMPIDMSSKKILIITVILFLEIGWCIPALLYILCCKKKKEKSSNVYMFLEPDLDSKKFYKERFKIQKQGNKTKMGKKQIYERPSKVEINMMKQNDECGGLKILKMPRKINVNNNYSLLSKNSMGTGTQSFYSSKVCSTEVARVVYDKPIVVMKPSVKEMVINNANVDVVAKEKSNRNNNNNNRRNRIIKLIENNHRQCQCTPEQSIEETSIETIQELESRKTVTLLAKDNTIIADTSPINKSKSQKEHQKTSITKVMRTVRSKTALCPCTDCCKDAVNTELKDNKQTKKPSKIIKQTKSIIKNANKTEKEIKLSKYDMQKIDINKGKGLKLNTGQPYLEITIAKPQKDITVDIRSTSKDATPRIVRPSRIPKRAPAVATNDTQTTQESICRRCPIDPKIKNKSFIPQPKKQVYTVDDLVIKNRNTSTRENKLNVTL